MSISDKECFHNSLGSYELTQIEYKSNSVHENTVELQITNSGDSLVYNTNNSGVCLYKHFHLSAR